MSDFEKMFEKTSNAGTMLSHDSNNNFSIIEWCKGRKDQLIWTIFDKNGKRITSIPKYDMIQLAHTIIDFQTISD